MDKIAKIQQEIGVLVKTETNPYFKSKYMDINGLLEQLLPLLEKYNLTVVQPLSNIEGKPSLKTIIWDNDDKDKDGGHTRIVSESEIPLPENPDPQKMGSAITYYRRYALQSLFLLRAEDDDANHASSHKIPVKTPQPSTEIKKDEDINLEDIPF